MKKILVYGMLAVLLLAGGCGREADGVGGEESGNAEVPKVEDISTVPEEPEEALPERSDGCEAVSLTLTGPEAVDAGKGSFAFSLNPGHEEETWYYDEFFRVERYVEGAWEALPISGGFCGNTMYMEIKGESPQELEIEWTWVYEELDPGIYCLMKQVFPQRDGFYNEMIWKNLSAEEQQNFARNPGPDREAGEPAYAVFEIPDKLGVRMTVRDVTPAGLVMELSREGGSPDGELQYGEAYRIERLEEGRWIPVEETPLPEGTGRAWHDVAYSIEEEPQIQEISWEWIYGELPPGQYRFCKEVMDFRGSGDYDTCQYRAEFVIE